MSFKEFQFDGFTYRSNKPLMLISFIIILIYAIFCFNYSGWSGKTYYYTECPNNTMTGKCLNAFYNSNLCDDKHIKTSNPLCTEKYMAEGTSLGEKAPWFIVKFNLIAISFIGFILLINTLIFNRGFFKWLWGKIRNAEVTN